MSKHLPYFLAPLLGFSGCATIAPTASRDARNDVAARLHQPIPESDVPAMVKRLLAHPLNAETAAAVALLNNPQLAADFEQIGIAQADWVQAGILRNPVLELGLEFPTSPPSTTRIQASFTEGFLELLTLPRRREIAEQEYLAVRSRICARAVDLAANAKAQLLGLQADAEVHRCLQAVLELEHSAYELARQQQAAGDVPEIDIARRREALAQRQLDLDAAEAQAELDRLKLARTLGTAETFSIEEALPPLPDHLLPADLETIAVNQRWEVTSAKAEVLARVRELGMTRDFAWVNSLDLGPQFERDVDGQKTVGPVVGLPLPLFDRGDARTAHAAAGMRVAEARLRAAALEARLDVRESLALLAAARTAESRYLSELLPARHDLVRLTNQRYNGMYASPFDLIAARQAELAAEQLSLLARRDTWLAWTQLERAAGGNLSNPHLP